MVDITKDKLFRRRLEKVTKIKNKNNKVKEFIESNKAIILLLASFMLLAVSNGFLVYNFFRTLSKL
ncbi:MAG: hypothetical protein J5507_02490 [Clostridia bacterium]|nr:hypothetical protein [Clostridia bacterium]